MQQICAFLFFVLAVLATATGVPNVAFAATDALMDYVAKPDDSYTWRVHALRMESTTNSIGTGVQTVGSREGRKSKFLRWCLTISVPGTATTRQDLRVCNILPRTTVS